MQQTEAAKKDALDVDEKILARARKRFRIAVDGDNEARQRRLEDKKFAGGEHWDTKLKTDREADNRPCLTIDRLKPQIKQVTNQQRLLRPSIQVKPSDSSGDPDTAEVLQGLIRNIETQSDADDAYDQAGKDQVETGLGWWYYRTEYCDDESRDQIIVCDRIRNPFSVYPDPAGKRRDRSDMMYLFLSSDFIADDLQARYPDAKMTSAAEFEGLGDDAPHWIQDERIRVVQYWEATIAKRPISLPNGKTRFAEVRKVNCYHLTGLEILERYEWAGKYIPYVPVLGEEIDLEGKVDLRGMVRGAKDPQRMFNYWKSATTEAMALAPKAPFLVAEGQVEEYLKMWQSANIKNLPYLIYTPKSIAGTLLPAPQRQVAETPIQAMLAETQASENDLRAATGFFDTNQRETREMSGVAIRARQAQGEHGNSDYVDGLARAVRFGGRILVDLIPKIYDVERVIRILGADEKPRNVMIYAGEENKPALPAGPDGAPMLPPGVEGLYDVGLGRYDVVVSAGPNYPTARQEFVEVMSGLFEKNPLLFQVVGDLFFENLDVPNAKQVAERLKKMLPPEVRDENAQIPPQAQAQIAQLNQQLQLTGQLLAEAQRKVETKELETQAKIEIAKMEIDSKERIELLKADVAKAKAGIDAGIDQAQIQAENARTMIKEGAESARQQLEHAHDRTMAQHAANTDLQGQHNEHEHADRSQSSEHGHAAHMQASKPEKAA